MSKKIGIPRGLFYYQFYPFWKSFFEELGAEIVVSDHTSRKILDEGVKKCVDEACLPVKIFFGHVENIKDKVDYLFLPRYTSVSKKEYVCPKFGGIPDMIRNTLSDLPEIIDTEINLRRTEKNALKAAIEIGRYFSDDNKAIKKAYKKALISYREFRQQVKKGIFPGELLDNSANRVQNRNKQNFSPIYDMINIKNEDKYKNNEDKYSEDKCDDKCNGDRSEEDNNLFNGKNRINSNMKLNIAVLGHGYNLYDSYCNMNALYKLRNLGANIITIDMIDENIINEKSNLLNKKTFWYFGSKIIGCAYHLLDRNDIDGIVYVMSFGCGIDSFICDLVERAIRRNKNIPFIILTIDEHTGEAGMDTRIEAFIDMIRWRKKYESDISSHGKHVYMCQSSAR
ncbi:MAG TPA: hypothetical protein GXX37_06475 [Clostridiaceae bacterium]|nr:hypothetical protein [Clostridiaceae bacterium]